MTSGSSERKEITGRLGGRSHRGGITFTDPPQHTHTVDATNNDEKLTYGPSIRGVSIRGSSYGVLKVPPEILETSTDNMGKTAII